MPSRPPNSGWNQDRERLQVLTPVNRQKTPRVSTTGPLPWPNPQAAIVRPLLAWYRRAGRDLPWRQKGDPYSIWISEVMLQQTQVERVKDFFKRFLDLFPTVADLAAADEAVVLQAWEGLGYYRRARQLHAAAQQIVADCRGIFPQTAGELRALPGIGRYTAAAIASIAYDQPEPIIEANSRRVLARLAGDNRLLKGARADEPLWQLAAALVPKRQGAGQFNQALMDFGSIICTSDNPRCFECPLSSACHARLQNRVAQIPNLPAPPSIRQLQETALVLTHRGRLLVQQRQAGEWWEGLWDFPRTVPDRVVTSGRRRRLGEVSYTVTHHKVTCRVASLKVIERPRPGGQQRWVRPAYLSELAMTAPGRRIAQLINGLF